MSLIKLIIYLCFLKNTQNKKICYFNSLIHKKIIKINSKVNLKSKNSKKNMILTNKHFNTFLNKKLKYVIIYKSLILINNFRL
jgi:hypothetical protein